MILKPRERRAFNHYPGTFNNHLGIYVDRLWENTKICHDSEFESHMNNPHLRNVKQSSSLGCNIQSDNKKIRSCAILLLSYPITTCEANNETPKLHLS
jgi:hypothetical protein